MIRTGHKAPRRRWDRASFLLLAVLFFCAGAEPVFGQAVAFRNECHAPVIVHAVSVFGGMLQRDRPYLLRSGDVTPRIVLPGDKVITVYDAQVPNRVLFQGALPASSVDLRFGILPDVPAPRVRLRPIHSSSP
jgi:hypothetical protein